MRSSTPSPTGRFSTAYVEACGIACLRRWLDRTGPAAAQLERGDFYGWRDSLPPTPGVLRVRLLADPQDVVIGRGRAWWVPRLDQLIERLEALPGRSAPAGSAWEVRQDIAQRLAERLRARDCSWEEAGLELLQEREGGRA